MTNSFKKATKKKQKLRLLLEGASGSGKTYSALLLAQTLAQAEKKRIAFIDTEFGSASIELKPPYTPEKYIELIREAANTDEYGVLIIDSISHEWSGQGGCLDIQSSLGGSFNDWKKVTPRHNNFINAILQANIHIIGCARTKSDYVMEESTNKSGKATTKPVKVGTKTEQREGLEFEFTTIFRLNQNHVASVSKDRTSLFENRDEVINNETGNLLINWLNSGCSDEQEVKTFVKDDTDIYLGLLELKTEDELNSYYLEHKKNVNNIDDFIFTCKQRKETILAATKTTKTKKEEETEQKTISFNESDET